MTLLVEAQRNVKRRVDVTVMGMPLSVRTEREDAWVHGLAGQVTRRLDELKRGAKNASVQQLSVLVALNMAEELQLEREKNAALLALAETSLTRVQGALAALDAADAADAAAADAAADDDDDGDLVEVDEVAEA